MPKVYLGIPDFWLVNSSQRAHRAAQNFVQAGLVTSYEVETSVQAGELAMQHNDKLTNDSPQVAVAQNMAPKKAPW